MILHKTHDAWNEMKVWFLLFYKKTQDSAPL